MTLARYVLQLLDRTGGRWTLELYATWHARRASGRDIRVLYDGVWMHTVDGCYWGDSPRFAYHRNISAKWLRYADQQETLGREFWFFR